MSKEIRVKKSLEPYKDVLLAWIAGDDIQFSNTLDGDDWYHYNPDNSRRSPNFEGGIRWRVAPVNRYHYAYLTGDGLMFSEDKLSEDEADRRFNVPYQKINFTKEET